MVCFYLPIATGPNHVANRLPAILAKICNIILAAKHPLSWESVHGNPSKLLAAGYAKTAVAKTYSKSPNKTIQFNLKKQGMREREREICLDDVCSVYDWVMPRAVGWSRVVRTSKVPPNAARPQQIGRDCSNSIPSIVMGQGQG